MRERRHALVSGFALELQPGQPEPDGDVRAEGEDREDTDQPERPAPGLLEDLGAVQTAPSRRSAAISPFS
jgi:hypothetical protein